MKFRTITLNFICFILAVSGISYAQDALTVYTLPEISLSSSESVSLSEVLPDQIPDAAFILQFPSVFMDDEGNLQGFIPYEGSSLLGQMMNEQIIPALQTIEQSHGFVGIDLFVSTREGVKAHALILHVYRSFQLEGIGLENDALLMFDTTGKLHYLNPLGQNAMTIIAVDEGFRSALEQTFAQRGMSVTPPDVNSYVMIQRAADGHMVQIATDESPLVFIDFRLSGRANIRQEPRAASTDIGDVFQNLLATASEFDTEAMAPGVASEKISFENGWVTVNGDDGHRWVLVRLGASPEAGYGWVALDVIGDPESIVAGPITPENLTVQSKILPRAVQRYTIHDLVVTKTFVEERHIAPEYDNVLDWEPLVVAQSRIVWSRGGNQASNIVFSFPFTIAPLLLRDLYLYRLDIEDLQGNLDTMNQVDFIFSYLGNNGPARIRLMAPLGIGLEEGVDYFEDLDVFRLGAAYHLSPRLADRSIVGLEEAIEQMCSGTLAEGVTRNMCLVSLGQFGTERTTLDQIRAMLANADPNSEIFLSPALIIRGALSAIK